MELAIETPKPAQSPPVPPPEPMPNVPTPAGIPEAAKELLATLQPAVSKTSEGGKEPEKAPDQKVDQKPPEAEKPPAQEDQFAKKFAALSRKDRMVYEREKEVKEREAKIATIEKAKGNIEDWLRAGGYSIPDVAQYVMRGNGNGKEPIPAKEPQAGDEVKKLREEIALKDRIAAQKEAAQTQQQAIAGLENYVKSDATKYPLCGTFVQEAIPFALDIAWKYRQTYGKDPEVAEVFDKVESVLREQKQADLQNLSKIPLFSDYFKASKEAPKPNGSNGQGTSTPTKTLTNAPTFVPPEPPKGQFRSEDERIRYFASMIKDQ